MGSIITGWILSVLGIAILSVLVDIILPEGQMQKYIKSIFSVIVIFVIVTPFVNIDFNKIEFDKFIYNNSSSNIDDNYIQNFNQQYKESLEKTSEEYLAKNGFDKVVVEIQLNLENNYIDIENVKINIENLVMNSQAVHINKYAEIKGLIANFLGVKEDKIVVYEW